MAQRRDIGPEAIALFAELENAPRRGRDFEGKTRELARLLGLTAEWWTGNHVNDDSRELLHRPPYIAYQDWHRCRAIGPALLEALGAESGRGIS
jgi:hypothetical protein